MTHRHLDCKQFQKATSIFFGIYEAVPRGFGNIKPGCRLWLRTHCVYFSFFSNDVKPMNLISNTAVTKPVIWPVIAIDGPTASGKGTVAQRVAHALGFHYLDSGSLYRLAALAAVRQGVPLTDDKTVAEMSRHLDIRFVGEKILLAGQDVSDDIRSEAAGQNASIVAALPQVREALLDRQRAFRESPGLVCDGRDMGSVIFPDAALKIFLTASVEARAERRTKQLKQKGMSAIIDDVVKELRIRDERDINRPVAPLKRLHDAQLLDTTEISADEAVASILDWYSKTPKSSVGV